MTVAEKINMIHASSSFTSGGVKRLGIPELVMSDGPHGVRPEHGRDWDKVLNVKELNEPLALKPGSKKGILQNDNDLNSAELEQVAYWKPERIGEVIFNYWD